LSRVFLPLSQQLGSYRHLAHISWHNKALVFNHPGRYEDALHAAHEAIRHRTGDPDNWIRKAESLKNLCQPDEARSVEMQAARLRGKAPFIASIRVLFMHYSSSFFYQLAKIPLI
jgi:Flp pilus assembly protein TadD